MPEEVRKIRLLEEWLGDKPGTIKSVGVFMGLFPKIADDLVDRGVAEEYLESAKKKKNES